MIITALQQAKKDSNRVNLFLDNEFWICVDKNEILKFDLYKGKELSKEDKSSLEKSSKSTRALNKAYSYILRRPRSKKEITDYLSRKEIPEVTIKEIITELKEKEIISDYDFSKWLINNRLHSGRYGESKIKYELALKGVDKITIKKAFSDSLSSHDPNILKENARKFALKSIKNIKAENKYKLKEKLINKLMSRGYSYKISMEVYNEILSDSKD